jgi:hypothetical protein
MTVAAVRDSVLSVLRGTRVGDELATEAETARARLEARRAARAAHDGAQADIKRIPSLMGAVARAEATYAAETARLARVLITARREYAAVASRSSHILQRAEADLRRSAPPFCHGNGPVVQAIVRAVAHLKSHNVDEHTRRFAEAPKPARKPDVGRWEVAKRLVSLADGAAERVAPLDFALAELADLQLEVEPDAAAVREIVEYLPERCECGEVLGGEGPMAMWTPSGAVSLPQARPTRPPWLDAASTTTTTEAST